MLLRPAHRQHHARSCPGQVTFVRKHDLMQTIVGFPSNLFAFMKIQLKNMRICVCFHQLCNANKKGHQPNKVTRSGKFLCSAVAAHNEARTCRERETRDSDTAFQTTPQRTDTHTQSYVNTRFGKYSGKHNRLCLKLTYTAEKGRTEQLCVLHDNLPFLNWEY